MPVRKRNDTLKGIKCKMKISVLITAIGFLGSLISIFLCFFQVKDPINILKKDMGFIIIWLSLMSIGIVNLYNSIDTSEPNISVNEIDDQEASIVAEQNKDVPQPNDEEANLSEVESLIKQNWDLIQQLKEQYSDEDTKIIENNSVKFWVYEKAGYIYSDLKKTGKYEILEGEIVSPYKVVILDYSSDDIIYEFSPEDSNFIKYSPGNQDKFYCIIFHENYDVYVTPPIQVVGGETDLSNDIFLSKKDDKYTPLFQLCANKKDSSDEYYVNCSTDYRVLFYCQKINSNKSKTYNHAKVLDSGILSCYGYEYFSLNTNYVMELSLYHESNPDLELSNTTFNGFIKNSNLVDINFSIDSENKAEDKTEE